jgi:serine/threonine-protein kinase
VAALALVALLGGGAWWLLGSAQGEVPQVVGLGRDDAVRAVADAGFAPVVVPVASPPELTDRVVGASPDVGARADTDSPVTLRVGRGPGLIQVPLLVGRSPEAARVAAEQAGLVLTPVPRLRATDDPTEVGAVVGQNPVPGSLLPAGAAVELVVGERRATLQVPDVTGRDRASAVATLEGVGLEVTVREVDGRAGATAGTVVAQRPTAGTSVERGSIVTLDVARTTTPSSSSAAATRSATSPGADGDTAGDPGTAAPDPGDSAPDPGPRDDGGGLLDGVFG